MALFIHNKNQELLWNVINKTQIFQLVFAYSRNNEPELWFRAHIQQYYQKIQNKILSVEDLNICNHEIIAIMMNNLKSFSENNGNTTIQQNHQPPQQVSQLLPHTVENKQELYSRQFNERQKEYELMNTKPTPPVPDINNNIKDEVISNMDELIKLHMQQREAEMKQFAPQPITKTPLENSFKPNNIKIENTSENITLMADVVLNDLDKPRKNVSWSDNNESEKIYQELHNEMDDLKTQVLNIANSFHSFQEEMRNFMKNFSNKEDIVHTFNNVEIKDLLI
jgi:hypothetical protein